MKKLVVYLSIISAIISCNKQSELSKNFQCNRNSIENTKGYFDFKNNFKLFIPTNWKITKHYSDTQSEIFCADTIKQLSETFILNASFNIGELNLDDTFIKQSDSLIKINFYEKGRSGLIKFQEKPAYYYVAKGTKNGFQYHQFNLIVKNSENTYFTAYSEVYGAELVDERICKSISILENIEFLQ